MEELIKQILEEIGENPEREGLKKTPKRVTDAIKFLTSGYNADINKVVNGAVFKKESDGMIIVRDIEFFSLCEHHMLPFYGKCHIGYIPRDKIIGMSKLPRIVDVYSRRLQVQERLTEQIAKEIDRTLNPLGVGVVMDAVHMCMMMRGVEKQNSRAVTSSVYGIFSSDQKTRTEFLDLIR